MEFTINKFDPTQGLNVSHRKENRFDRSFKVISFTDKGFNVDIDLRIYQTDATSYACVWFGHCGGMANGSGKAGGYGYHRTSAAVYQAFKSAGIEFTEAWGGSGNGSIEYALRLIAKEKGINNFFINESHG